MKIRTGFVSNSSTTSFIVTRDLTDDGYACLKLTKEQLRKMTGYAVWHWVDGDYKEIQFKPEKGKDYWLTQYVGDCEELPQDMEKFEYYGGQHGNVPYDYEYFNEYQFPGSYSVYLLKEHDEAKQMTFGAFVADFLGNYGNSYVLVENKPEHTITLKVID